MLMRSGLRDISIQKSQQGFDVIEAFSELNPRRKILLCDQLFTEGSSAFHNMVELLWPEAYPSDARKLEHFLYKIKSRLV
ncbi:MAG: hypothetical protein GC137_01825 [Alphaproteobacteria bacterium]|nr:hypothetical protein [Alphaproteobacteria bacterium]